MTTPTDKGTLGQASSMISRVADAMDQGDVGVLGLEQLLDQIALWNLQLIRANEMVRAVRRNLDEE